MSAGNNKSWFTLVGGIVGGGLVFTALEEWIGGWAVALLYVVGVPAVFALLYRWLKTEDVEDAHNERI